MLGMMENANHEQIFTFQTIVDSMRAIGETTYTVAQTGFGDTDLRPFCQSIEGCDQTFEILPPHRNAKAGLAIAPDITNVLSRCGRGA
ncbi:hypothetical protein BW41_03016 [Sphingomonas sp. RIT328]|nr:hypothetical protein BW41_03016 [Sphingomonas sp. RIT328]